MSVSICRAAVKKANRCNMFNTFLPLHNYVPFGYMGMNIFARDCKQKFATVG